RRCDTGWGDSLSIEAVPVWRDHPTPLRIPLRYMRSDPPPPGEGEPGLPRPHRLGRIGLRQRMGLCERGQRHRGLVDALDRWPGRKVDLLGERDRDVADHADVGKSRLIAMAEAGGRLVAGEMALERGQRLDGPVTPPRRLLAIAQIELVVEILPH